MMVEMLEDRVVVMTGLRRTMTALIINRKVGVAGVRRLGPLRFRVMAGSMDVGRDLAQVRETQGQGDAQPETALESGIVLFHDSAKLTAKTPPVNAYRPTSRSNHPTIAIRARRPPVAVSPDQELP